MRYVTDSLSQTIDKVSQIDWKIAQIDKKEPENKFIDNVRSMIASLSQCIDKVSEIDKKEPENKFDKKLSQTELIKKFPNTYQFSIWDLNKFYLLLRKGVYPY